MSTPPRTPADFSNVRSRVSSSEIGTDEPARADFGNVRSSVTSTEHATANATTGDHTYTVVSGDTLSGIAKKYYGKASLWPRIFEANRDQLDNPDLIRPGQVLKIPVNEAPGLAKDRPPPENP